jgi:hypothetical protein
MLYFVQTPPQCLGGWIKYNDLNSLIEPIVFCLAPAVRNHDGCAAAHVEVAESCNPKQHDSQRRRETLMSTWQAILCGMMLSWTPSVVFLAWVVWKERIGTEDM